VAAPGTSGMELRVCYDQNEVPLYITQNIHNSSIMFQDGKLFAFGYGAFGQLGQGNTQDELTPVEIAGALAGKRVVSMAAAFHHSLAVCDDGSLYAFGQGVEGQLVQSLAQFPSR